MVLPLITSPEPALIFTKRRDDLSRHPGEISFPGGLRHPEDPDLLQTALRETEEELGIPASAFDVLGYLEPLHTFVSGILITPVVGALDERPVMKPSPHEIEEVLEVSVADLQAAERLVTWEHEGRSWTGQVYEIRHHVIWGATGKILHDFLERFGEAARNAPGADDGGGRREPTAAAPARIER